MKYSYLFIIILFCIIGKTSADVSDSFDIQMKSGNMDITREGYQGQSHISASGDSAIGQQYQESYGIYDNIIWINSEKASVRSKTPEIDNQFRKIGNMSGLIHINRQFQISMESETEENVTTEEYTQNTNVLSEIDISGENGSIDIGQFLRGMNGRPMISSTELNATGPFQISSEFRASGRNTWTNVKPIDEPEK